MNNINFSNRSIILAIIYNIVNNYDLLINKNIIIEILKYRKIISKLFPNLNISNSINNNYNYYFNINNIIKNQDVFIYYLNNYNNLINTDKINLMPWYNSNNPLITFIYNKDHEINIKLYKNFINYFNKNKRSINNNIWDINKEINILNKYNLIHPNIDIHSILNINNTKDIIYSIIDENKINNNLFNKSEINKIIEEIFQDIPQVNNISELYFNYDNIKANIFNKLTNRYLLINNLQLPNNNIIINYSSNNSNNSNNLNNSNRNLEY